MTRDEQRTACIEAIFAALFKAKELRTQDEVATAAFDSLHGIARVVPVEGTEEMIKAAAHQSILCGYRNLYRAMSAAGDLTNPPEGKP